MWSRADSGDVDKVTRIAVDVMFLRMPHPPIAPAPSLPGGFGVERVEAPSVGFYRDAYDLVGADYCWWLRRVLPDADLVRLMRDRNWSMHVLRSGGTFCGFYELEASGGEVNLSYFGLAPDMIGRGLGRAFLRSAIDEAWSRGARSCRVNTCTADHPRALPLYVEAGFVPVRKVQEVWSIPDRLRLRIPAALRI